MTPPLVTEKSVPPASTRRDECFWCRSKIGEPHRQDCSATVRRAKVRAIVEYEVDVHGGGAPDAPERFEFNRNEGTWCADNMLAELGREKKRRGCLCDCVAFAFVSWVNDEVKESR